MKAAVGDWIRYTYDGGKLAIGLVCYVKERDGYPWGTEYLTCEKTVHEDAIVEVRKGATP